MQTSELSPYMGSVSLPTACHFLKAQLAPRQRRGFGVRALDLASAACTASFAAVLAVRM